MEPPSKKSVGWGGSSKHIEEAVIAFPVLLDRIRLGEAAAIFRGDADNLAQKQSSRHPLYNRGQHRLRRDLTERLGRRANVGEFTSSSLHARDQQRVRFLKAENRAWRYVERERVNRDIVDLEFQRHGAFGTMLTCRAQNHAVKRFALIMAVQNDAGVSKPRGKKFANCRKPENS